MCNLNCKKKTFISMLLMIRLCEADIKVTQQKHKKRKHHVSESVLKQKEAEEASNDKEGLT